MWLRSTDRQARANAVPASRQPEVEDVEGGEETG